MADTDSEGVAAGAASTDGGPIARVDGPTVDLLVLSDLHIRATGERFPVEELPVESHDLVLSLGDVIDENREHAPSAAAGEAYEERGRAFLEALDERGVPVLVVPGNHDPVDCTRRLADGLANVHPLHDEIREVAVYGAWSLTVAGWGFEGFDFTPALLPPSYPDIPVDGDVRTPEAVAEAVLGAAGGYLAGDLSADELAERIGCDPGGSWLRDTLSTLERRYGTLRDLLDGARAPTLLATHVSPYGVPFDVRDQHSHDGDHHGGSVALRVALAASGVDGCLSGHTHQRGLTAAETVDGHAYAHNPGDAGVSSVTVHRDGTVQTSTIDIDWR